MKKAVFTGLFPLAYRLYAAGPVEKRNVFLEIRYPELTDNLKLLYAACRKEKEYVTETAWLGAGESSSLSYILRSLAVIRRIARAERIFVDESSNMLAALPVRKETRIIQTWHACGAFKRFGHGLQNGLEEEYYSRYSLVTVSAPEVEEIYRTSMNQAEGVVRGLGISRTDRFFSRTFLQKARERTEAVLPQAKGRQVILFAPTFRGNVARAQMPELPDIRRLKEAAGESCILVYRGHPAVKERPRIPADCRDFFFDATELLTTEDWLCRADICITDYSSLVFEFSLLLRPMLFYVYDIDTYDTERGFYYPFRDFAPGPVCRNTEELAQGIREIRERGGSPGPEVEAFRQRFMSACDGHATERILRYIREEL